MNTLNKINQTIIKRDLKTPVEVETLQWLLSHTSDEDTKAIMRNNF